MAISAKVGGQKGNEAKEQTGNYCDYFQKLKGRNLIVKWFKQTIEIM